MLDVKIVEGYVWTQGEFRWTQLGIEDGKIRSVDTDAPARHTIRANGKAVIPGLIDTQVHFREPGLTHKEDIGSGSAAAVIGGVTTYFEMPNTDPTTTDAEALAEKLEIASRTSWADHAFFVGATAENVERLGELEALPGCAGVKIFLGSSTGPLLLDDPDDLRVALAHGRRRVAAHCEDEARNAALKATEYPEGGGVEWHPRIRDAESARRATERFILAGEAADRPVHVLHVNAREELTVIAAARERGVDVTCEITPQHLWFSAPSAYAKLGTRVQQNPPIREEEHREALFDAFRAGFFDVIGSDHAPHTLEEKARPYPASPSGMPGVQTTLSVLLTLLPPEEALETLVRLMAQGPARIFGIEGKGHLREGFDADVAIVDPSGEWTMTADDVASRCGWSPWEGRKLRGWATHTIVGGRVVYEDGELLGEPSGKPVRFAPSSE